MRHIIIAAGEGTRWNSYTGKPKHLIDPAGDGEPLIARLCRQLAERGHTDVVVTGPHSYATHVPAHVDVFEPAIVGDTDMWRGATKFVNTIPYWSSDDRTVIWYGDTWIEDTAVDAIVDGDGREFLHWCRMGASPVTGCRYGENFAVSFWPENRAEYLSAIVDAVAAHRDGHVIRSGGWEIARAAGGAQHEYLRVHRSYDCFRDIGGGFTEDFDQPEDFDTWRENWRKVNG